MTASGAPPAIRYTVWAPDTSTNVPSGNWGAWSFWMLPAAPVAPSIASPSMLIVTLPKVAFWPPEYSVHAMPDPEP